MKMNLIKIFIQDVQADFVYKDEVYSWILDVRLPENNVLLKVKERNQTFGIADIKGNLIEAVLTVSKAKLSTQETSGIKGKYIGKHTPVIFFPELQRIEERMESGVEDIETNVDAFEDTAAEIFRKDWGIFGIGLYTKVHMLNTRDGVLRLADDLADAHNLIENEFYFIDIEEVLINSYKILK